MVTKRSQSPPRPPYPTLSSSYHISCSITLSFVSNVDNLCPIAVGKINIAMPLPEVYFQQLCCHYWFHLACTTTTTTCPGLKTQSEEHSEKSSIYPINYGERTKVLRQERWMCTSLAFLGNNVRPIDHLTSQPTNGWVHWEEHFDGLLRQTLWKERFF